MSEGIVTIKAGREKPIIQQHPWIFSGAIASAQNAAPGNIVTVVNQKGEFLARGYWNPKSQIQVRILTWQGEPVDENWWRRMLKRALESRMFEQQKGRGFIGAFRLVNAENDFLPGLIADIYGRWIVIQALTLGIDQRKHDLARILVEVWNSYFAQMEFSDAEMEDLVIRGVYERSDVDVRGKEGLQPETGLLWGKEPPQQIKIKERNINYLVDVYAGHKTGFYLDQRSNRYTLLDLISNDFTPEDGQHRILNLFSYTGGFGVAGLWGGFGNPGQIINVDSSDVALKLAERNFALNFPGEYQRPDYQDHTEFIQADAFDYLHAAVKRGDQFDVIVCDPPKFAHNKQQVNRATRGYKDLNLNCFKLIKSGGYLMTFSCSGAISADLFQKVVFGALADSGRQAQIIQHLGPADDHPVALTFPEGAYLKGLLLRVY